MSNVIDFCSYRAARQPTRSTRRLILGALCTFNGKLVTVAGTWTFTGARGQPGTVKTRALKPGVDPQTDGEAKGYLLQPTEGGDVVLAHWADVDCGDLVLVTRG